MTEKIGRQTYSRGREVDGVLTEDNTDYKIEDSGKPSKKEEIQENPPSKICVTKLTFKNDLFFFTFVIMKFCNF